jgi:hypothetical protein
MSLPGQAPVKPEPGLVFDEAFVDHRQPAQRLLESHGLAHTSPLAVDHTSSPRTWASSITLVA